MEFCVITPTKYLDRWGRRSSHHLVLAHLLDNRDYFEFYRQRAEDGDVVILDNGAYERSLVTPEELVTRTRELLPTCVVCPDDVGYFSNTILWGVDFRERLKAAHISVQTMQVVHAEDGDLTAFELSYRAAAHKHEWIGFSRLTKKYGLPGESWMGRRPGFITNLIHKAIWRPDRRHHCLGMNRGSLHELQRLSSIWVGEEQAVESIDSSAPVWRGLNGFRLTDAWPDYDFRLEHNGLSPAHEHIADHNLTLVLEACNARQSR